MRANENLVVVGNRVVLVPYLEEHVQIYHEWMKSEELQQQTASEPLSLEEEYAMQRSWREDTDKCTFIVLAPTFESNRVGESAKWGGMIGDVNLFFNDQDDPHTAELEIMIAETSFRGQGAGSEAAALMMLYALNKLGVNKFVVKASLRNTASISLFRKQFGFKTVGVSEVFQEITMERHVEGGKNSNLKDSGDSDSLCVLLQRYCGDSLNIYEFRK
ncbi:N-acetyltransferase 9-like protein [Cladochytrium replicatum]|nr:N-acetyltransferase 9-like protein [Cladochytrium replicatum]